MKLDLDELCTHLIILASTIMLALCGVFGIGTLKLCIYAIVVLSFAKILESKSTQFQLITFTAFIMSALFIVLVDGGLMSSFIVSLSTIVLAISLFKNGIEEYTWKFIKVCTYIVSFAFIAYMFLSPSRSIYDQLLLYFENPNMAGIAISAPAMMLVLMFLEGKSKTKKAVTFAILAMMVYMVYETQNRGSFFSLVFLLIVALFMMFQKGGKRLTSPSWFAIFKLTPIFIMFIYIWLYRTLPVSIELLGKPLFSGREGAWIIALENVFKNPFARHLFEEGTLNLFLEGAARYGIFSMIAYFAFLISLRKSKTELQEMTSLNYLAYVAFHCCLFQQSFESTLLTGSYTVYVWVFLFLGIASMKTGGTAKQKGKQEI